MMFRIIQFGFLIALLSVLVSCSNDMAEVNMMFDSHELKTEVAKDVELLYSDSSNVQLRVLGPELVRHISYKNPMEEFTKGITVEFLNNYGQVSSWLEAKYAVRKEKEKLIIAQDSVVLYNRENEKLETSELIWDEENHVLRTDRFVQISQPMRGDTSYGYGFESNEDFTRFRILRKYSAKTNIKDLSKAFEKAKSKK